MRESNLLRLVQAFIFSRITYSTPYLRLTRAESERLETSLRKADKMALGLPLFTATHKLMALGITNTVSELIEATLTAQYERLSLTHAGRAILQQVGISRMTPNYADLTPEYRRSLYIPPIPKRMHLEHHAERRADRAHQFEKRFSHIYGRLLPPLEASDGGSSPHRSWYTACSIRKTVIAAEEVAIALADPVTKVVISDSQQAIRNYDVGRISCQALHVLLSSPPPSTSRVLLWAPAHESLSGNTQVHALARDLSCRAECRIHRAASPDTSMSHDSQLTTYTDILQYYRLGRCIYPPAHRDLTRREAVQWRKLQTGSFPHPLLYSRIFPKQIATPTNTLESWESLLRVSEPADQRRLIQRAVEAAVSQGIPADLL
ncbi:hypothetical protein HPB50_024129 [Hyalomma asiaticum]|uniref:Uncharacterized protein n=1 Tax=Hyalomma asiaticum TaxID=266040 RepID=A0ACB7SKS5_HYAAI|nr:hypothetical protein HPB50_024129 [Hyalomma asiaticum]